MVFLDDRLLQRVAGVSGLQATLNESLQDSFDWPIRGLNDHWGSIRSSGPTNVHLGERLI